MKFTTLHYLAILTAVRATPGDTFSSPANSDITPLHTHTVGQGAQTDVDMRKYCPAVFLDNLNKIEMRANEFRGESPNNQMPYSEFRTLAIKYCDSEGEIMDAVRRRQDPELLKTFHLEFNDETLEEPLPCDGLGPQIIQFYRIEAYAEQYEAKAKRLLQEYMAAVDTAEEVRSTANECME